MRFFIGGIDEAGRGPLAGPVTAAAVVLPADYQNPSVTDSKKLSAAERDRLFDEIVGAALAWSAISVGPRRIERINIREATKEAMIRSALNVREQLRATNPETEGVFLIDGNMRCGDLFTHETIVKGDAKIMAIAAASILAKVTRDRVMQILEQRYPGYGLGEHMGYPTPKHRAQIAALGPSKIHRRTFAGVKEWVPREVETHQTLLDLGNSAKPRNP